jgi:hypothetical protein
MVDRTTTHKGLTVHPVLKAFYDDINGRYADLFITMQTDRLIIEWRDLWVVAVMRDNSDEVLINDPGDHVGFTDDGCMFGIAGAFARRISVDAVERDEHPSDDEIAGTFGALVWSTYYALQIQAAERQIEQWRSSLLRLNPTIEEDDTKPCQVCISAPCGCDTEE